MKFHLPHLLPHPFLTVLVGIITLIPPTAQGELLSFKITTKKETLKHNTPTKSHPYIILINGDQLNGTPQKMDDQGILTFHSESLIQPTAFPIKNVLTLNLDNQEKIQPEASLARLKLYPRFRENYSDTITGSLKKLTPDTIQLNTWYAGPITIKRSMVQSVNIINNGPGNYFGPNSLSEWQLSSGEGSWKYHNGKLISLSNGGIGRDVGLTEKSHISFDARWELDLRFKVQLYSSDTSNEQPDAYYNLNFNRNYAFLRTYGKSKNKIRFGGGRWQKILAIPTSNHAHFDIFADREQGTFDIYIDGQKACLLQSQEPDPSNLGTGFAIIAEAKNQLTISSISITPWNGTSKLRLKKTISPTEQDADSSPTDDTQAAKTSPPHKIILKNGDEVPGTVGKVKDGRMIIETEYTPIKIPIKRIQSLSLGDQGEEPKKYAGDVRAWFQQGGHITLKLISLKNGKLTGFSQPTGNVTIDLNALNRIDFHIYDPKANAIREE